MENTETKVLELSIDGHVTITTERFTELVKKEAQLEIVARTYFNSPSYELQNHLSLLFGPLPKPEEKGDDNA